MSLEKKLAQEFLKSSFSYKGFNYQIGGITMRFVEGISDAFERRYYIEYYAAIINDQVYIVTNKQLIS